MTFFSRKASESLFVFCQWPSTLLIAMLNVFLKKEELPLVFPQGCIQDSERCSGRLHRWREMWRQVGKRRSLSPSFQMVSLTPSLKCTVFLCFGCGGLIYFINLICPFNWWDIQPYLLLFLCSHSLFLFSFPAWIILMTLLTIFLPKTKRFDFLLYLHILKSSWCNSCLQISNPSTYHSFSSLSMVLSHSDSKFSLFDKTT